MSIAQYCSTAFHKFGNNYFYVRIAGLTYETIYVAKRYTARCWLYVGTGYDYLVKKIDS